MPPPKRFEPVCTTLRKHRPKRPFPNPVVTLRDRLVREALHDPQYDDLTVEGLRAHVEQDAMSQGLTNRLDYPWWWSKDAPKKPTTSDAGATEAQRVALAKARQRKETPDDTRFNTADRQSASPASTNASALAVRATATEEPTTSSAPVSV